MSDMQVLERLLRTRVSENNFSTAAISEKALTNILRLTLLAPSRYCTHCGIYILIHYSFNFQPYKIIIVRDAAMRQRVAEGMLGGNKFAVQAAPVTVIFAADTGKSVMHVIVSLIHRTAVKYRRSDCYGSSARHTCTIPFLPPLQCHSSSGYHIILLFAWY